MSNLGDTGETRAMRTKEDSADYRYFPDPDLPPLVIERDWVERVKAEMSELPRVMAARFVADYGLPEYDATTLTQSKAMAAYFEATAKACGHPSSTSGALRRPPSPINSSTWKPFSGILVVARR